MLRTGTSTLQQSAERLEEDTPSKDSTGTKDQVRKVVFFWESFDAKSEHLPENSQGNCKSLPGHPCSLARHSQQHLGTVISDILRREFCKLFSLSHNLPSYAKRGSWETFPQCIQRLQLKISKQLLGGKHVFTEHDLMKLLWMNASQTELEKLTSWFMDIQFDPCRRRAMTPPVLDPIDYQGLCSVFKHFAGPDTSEIPFDELVDLGLICEDGIDDAREHYDSDGNGMLDMYEFCEMMCPLGYRASAESQIGTLEDGTRITVNPKNGKWHLEKL